jgi:hypothetical protein
VDNDGDADPASADSAAADQAARQAFFKLLTDHGISPEQFRKDLVASVQNSADPRFDRGTAFSSIPAGLNLDAEA